MLYLELDSDKIIRSIEKLVARMEVHFATSGLKKVAIEFFELAKKSKERSVLIAKPYIALRIAVGAIIVGIILTSVWGLLNLHFEVTKFALNELVQTFEAFLNVLVFGGIAMIFLMTAETRIKRKRALQAIHELRALAHVIDMHQLTKDPEIVLVVDPTHPSAPTDTMTPFELMRYLDFCCDMLSLVAKMAALYVQNFDDPIVLSAVNDVESLTTGLANKIWQKIQTIHHYD